MYLCLSLEHKLLFTSRAASSWSWPLSALTNWNVEENASETSGAQVFKGWRLHTSFFQQLLPSEPIPQNSATKLGEAQAVLSSHLNGNWRASTNSPGEIAAQSQPLGTGLRCASCPEAPDDCSPSQPQRENQPGFFSGDLQNPENKTACVSSHYILMCFFYYLLIIETFLSCSKRFQKTMEDT